MPIEDICRSRDELVSAAADTPVRELCGLMDTYEVGSVVIEDDGRPRGIVTDRDVAMALGAGDDLAGATAADVMNGDPFVMRADDGVGDLFGVMAARSVRRMPVVEDGELCGIVTLDDLVVLLEDELSDLSSIIRAESPPYGTP